MSGMRSHRLDQRGSLNPLLIPLILVSLLFVAVASMAGWAYMSRQDYKNNSDQKAEAAVAVAVEKTKTEKDNEFEQKEKEPYRQYYGPEPFGSLEINYPKTWSVYVSERAGNSIPVDGYFMPKFVPAIDNKVSYALRVQITDTPYATVVKQFDSDVKQGKVKATAYIPAKNQSVTGVRMDGEVVNGKQGAMVILPLRDKTLKIWTESKDFLDDFNTKILPNYSFNQ